jgi:hypothetical protein
MDYTNTDFWIAIIAGGGVIASLSAGQQVFWKDPDAPQEFRVRAVVRDFCIGAFLTAVLYMFLPESFQGLISAGSSAAQTMKTSVTSAIQSGGSSSVLESMEIRTGPARF